MAGQSFAEWSGSNQSVAPTTPTTSSTPKEGGQSFKEWSGGTPLPSSKPMVFGVGENLTTAQQSVAQDVLSKEVIPVGVNAPINPEDINIKVPFTGDTYLSVKSPFSEPLLSEGKIKFNEPNIFSRKTDNKFGITKEQLLKDAGNAATTVTNFIGNIPSDILQAIPRALMTVYKEGQSFGEERISQLSPLEQRLYGGEQYVNVNKDISNRIKNGDGILSAYLGGISQKVLDVAFGADLFARGSTVLSKALETPSPYAKIEAWKSLGSPKDAAEAKSNYLKMAQQLHPDKVGGSNIGFQNLQKAKSLLGENFSELPSVKNTFQAEASKYLEWVGRQTKLTDPILTPNLKLKSEAGAPIDLNLPQIPEELPRAPVEKPTPTPEGIPTAPTASEALQAAEAKVAASPEYSTLYHGGEKIEKIDLGKSNFGKTFFMTDSPEYAAEYANKYKENGVINKIEIKKDAKLIDIKNAPKDVIDQIKKIAKGEATGRQIKITKPDGSIITIPEYKNIPESGFGNYSMKEIIDGAVRGKAHFAEAPGLVQIYKDLGYDGMVTYEDSGMRGKNIGIWNENVVKIPEKSTVSPELKTAPSPFAKSLEKTAIELGITKGFSEVASYTPSTLKEQSDLTNQVIESGPENIASILRGDQPLPLGLKGGPFTVGIETWLKTNTNEEVAYALANSPLASGVSESASELGLMQERNPDSAGAKITQIKKAREAKAGKVKTEKVKRAIRKVADATREVNLDKADLDWDNFLNNELAC